MEKENSWSHFLKGSHKYNSLALVGGVGLHAIDVFITISILPTIVKDIGGMEYYSLNTVLYIVASILGSSLSAKLLEKSSPRKAINIALVIFGVGTLMCTMAPTMIWMLIGRTVQGFGGGQLFALAYSLIRLLFEPRMWTRAMALISVMWGTATLIGPAMGGIFAEFGVWRASFGTITGLTVCYAFFMNQVLKRFDHKKSKHGEVKIPFFRLFLLVMAVLVVSLGGIDKSPTKNILGLVFCIILCLIIGVLERSPNGARLLPKNSFSLKSPLLFSYATIAFLVIGMQSEVFIPLFLQKIHAQTPFASGYMAALMAAGWSSASMYFSGLEKIKDIKRIITISPTVTLLGSLLLAYVLPKEESSLFSIGLGLYILGFGIGMGFSYLVTRVFNEAPDEEKDLASASITTVQLFFSSLGAALAGAIVNFNGITFAEVLADYSRISEILLYSFLVFPILALFSARIVAKQMKSNEELP